MLDDFVDPDDGMFDVSHWLAEKKGFLPVPILVTEPAVGYGAGAALVFLHDPLSGRAPKGETFNPQAKDASGKLVPPSISALFGVYTENDTWFTGGAHMGVWDDDNIRYTGAGALASVNMKFYGLGEASDRGINFNLETTVLFQGIKFRLNKSNIFAGVNYLFLDTKSKFDASAISPGLIVGGSSRDAAVSFTLEYDSRDTIFTPASGWNVGLDASLYREGVGSDSEFEKYKAKLRYFSPIIKDLVLGVRGELETVAGRAVDIPFYQYPFVDLRGIPMMRYQGNEVVVAEAELRWNFTRRWSAVGFGGVGHKTAVNFLDSNSNVYSKGVDLRYFIARRFGLHVGFDIAKGPEDTAFYLTTGHAWR